MMTINVTFNDEEETIIQKLKEEAGLNWHDFILISCGAVKKRDLKKQKWTGDGTQMTEHDETVKQIAETLKSNGCIEVSVNTNSPHCIMCGPSRSGMTYGWVEKLEE